MYRVFASRRILFMLIIGSIGAASFIAMASIALQAKRYDGVILCLSLIVAFLFVLLMIAKLTGMTRIPRLSSDCKTWIEAEGDGKRIIATPENVIDVERSGARYRVVTKEGAFDITPDSSGYDILVGLATEWLAAKNQRV
jgi:hypothetical protein